MFFLSQKCLIKKNIYTLVILILILILIRFYGVQVSISLWSPSSILMYLWFSMSTDCSLVVTPCLSRYFVALISCLSRGDVYILTFLTTIVCLLRIALSPLSIIPPSPIVYSLVSRPADNIRCHGKIRTPASTWSRTYMPHPSISAWFESTVLRTAADLLHDFLFEQLPAN